MTGWWPLEKARLEFETGTKPILQSEDETRSVVAIQLDYLIHIAGLVMTTRGFITSLRNEGAAIHL